MLFRKRKRLGPMAHAAGEAVKTGVAPESYYIGPEDLVKGSYVPRRRKKVRQFAVLVNTRVRIVTTGDVVEPEVYEALVAAGAVVPAPKGTDDAPPPPEDHGE